MLNIKLLKQITNAPINKVVDISLKQTSVLLTNKFIHLLSLPNLIRHY